MRHRQGVITALGALGIVAAVPAASTPASTSVTITVTGLRNTQGVVMACMTKDTNRFPRCRNDAQSYIVTVPARDRLVIEFDHVEPGTYAIALLHDENNNGKADRALSMIPREGFGFSRDAPVRMGPPSFNDAAFTVGTAASAQAIRMRYML